MKNLFFLAGAVGTFLFTSCLKEEPIGPSFGEGETIIFQERDPSLPLILSKPSPHPETRADEALTFEECYGRSFSLDYYPFENMENVKYPIIKSAQLRKDKPDWFTVRSLGNTTATSFAYSSFDYYEENSSMSRKISSGLNLNIKLFNLGAKRSMTEIFTSSRIEQTNAVYGQLDISVRDKTYDMQMNSSRISQVISGGYLHEDFVRDLYNLTPAELISDYGPFILSSFVTGGKATATYVGQYKSTSSSAAKERDMTTEISGAYGTNSGNVGVGKSYSNSSVSTNNFNSLYTSIRTIGGSVYGHNAFTIPTSIDNVNINLSSWVNTLSDPNTHKIIDINPNGLTPICELVLEDNLKRMLKNEYTTGLICYQKFSEPKIVVLCNNLDNTNKYTVYLITRYHNTIPINSGTGSSNNNTFTTQINNLAKEYSAFYKLRVEIYSGSNPPVFLFDMLFTLISFSDTDTIIEKNMRKYIDTQNNVIYLLTSGISEKKGYSIYIGAGDYLLDTYGIRKWVEEMPTMTIQFGELLNYQIMAL